MDSLYLESSSEPESSTTSPVRATKKRQKEDFADQQNMNKDLRLQTEGYQQNSHLRKKKKKKRHESTILGKDTHSSKDSSDPADPLEKEDKDDLLRKTPEKPRKKKRRHEVTHHKDTHNDEEASNETVQLDQEDVDDLLCKTPSEKPRKKKRRHEATHDKDSHNGKEASNETVQLDQEDVDDLLRKTPSEKPRKKKRRHEATHDKDSHNGKEASNETVQLDQEDVDDLLRKTPSEKPRKKKRRHEATHDKDSHNGKEASNETVQLDQEDVDDLLGKTPSEKPRKKKRRHEATHDKDSHNGKEASNETVQLDQEDDIFCEKATLKKKKKRAKQGETEDNITSKNDASGRNAEEVNVTMELENQKSKINKKRKECVRERKKTDATACSDCDEEAVVSTRTRLRKRMKSEGDGDEELVRHVQIGTKHLKKKFAKKNSKRVNEQLVEKLRQFVPNVDLKPVQDVAKMINYDLPRYIEFRRRGITLNTGRFTAKENQILRKNVEDFMALTGVDSATKLFFTDRFKEEEERITKLKRQHRFFASIANGIPRPSHRIYNRGRRIFDGRNYKGQFTKREIHTLLKFHKLYGNDWKKISDLTGRSAFSLQKRFAQFTTKEGAWSKKENQRLLRAVQDYIVRTHAPGGTRSTTARVRREVLYKSLPWQDIAAKVKTRSWSKCREKWMSILAVKMSYGAVLTSRKKQDVKIKLIKAMYEMQVEDIAHVDWEDLTAVVGNVPPSYVQKKWNALKMCYVPDWQTKSFADIIDFLYEKVLPNLEKELKNCEGGEDAEPNYKHQERYLLSYIFNDIDKEADDDDDDDDDDDIDVDIS